MSTKPAQWPSHLRYHAILDRMYGMLYLTDEEIAVIGHPLFLRLRMIRQNGLLLFTFPGATHTRFEHCIGVCDTLQKMLDGVWRNTLVAASKSAIPAIPPTPSAGSSDAGAATRSAPAVDVTTLSANELASVCRVARLAALLHDVGHGPLSHTFDAFALSPDKVNELVRRTPELEVLHPVLAAVLAKTENVPDGTGAKVIRIAHESMSILFAAAILHDLASPTEHMDAELRSTILAIAAVLADDPKPILDHLATPLWSRWVPLMRDLISAAPIDADRMDYLLRDSHSIGVSYGEFDRNRVLKSLLVCEEWNGTSSHYRLAVKRSGLAAVENFVLARFELFRQVYHHKTNTSVNLMLSEIAQAQARHKPFVPSSSWTALREFYEDASDDAFLAALRHHDLPRVREVATALHRRELWKRITDVKTERVADELMAALQERLPPLSVRKSASKISATKDLDSGCLLASRSPGGAYFAHPVLKWTDRHLSPLICLLHKQNLVLYRIYLAEQTPNRIREAKEAADPLLRK